MLALQASIGALNDVVDAPLDATQKPGKPIPQGLVASRLSLALAAAAGAAGLAMSAPSGLGTVFVAAAGLCLGYAYDLRLSRTRWSWLPLSLALPLLPLHAWLGASGMVPPGLLTLVPTAVLAGTALAVANGLVDVERDARVGRLAIVVSLGSARAWAVQTTLFAVVSLLAVLVAPSVPAGVSGQTLLPTASVAGVSVDALRLLRVGGVAVGIAMLIAGSAALRAHRAQVRERGWELEAIGVAAIGIGWLAGTAASAGGGA